MRWDCKTQPLGCLGATESLFAKLW
jgi:hypothetical protein